MGSLMRKKDEVEISVLKRLVSGTPSSPRGKAIFGPGRSAIPSSIAAPLAGPG